MSKNKKQNTEESDGEFNWVLAIVAGFFIWALLFDNRKKDKQIHDLTEKNQEMRNELNKINEIIIQADDLTREAKLRIQKLIDNSKPIEPEVKSELLQAFVLIQGKMISKALLSMGKIIENSLKKILSHQPEFKKKYKSPRFVDLITYAKETGLLEKDEFHFANGIRELRNDEAHQLNVKKDSSWEVSSVILATSIIIKLEDKKPKGWGQLPPLEAGMSDLNFKTALSPLLGSNTE